MVEAGPTAYICRRDDCRVPGCCRDQKPPGKGCALLDLPAMNFEWELLGFSESIETECNLHCAVTIDKGKV